MGADLLEEQSQSLLLGPTAIFHLILAIDSSERSFRNVFLVFKFEKVVFLYAP